MKRSIISLALSCLLLLTTAASVYALDSSIAVVKASSDYTQEVTKRQVVDMLVEDALKVYKSPSRISHAGFTAKMPSNIEIVTNRLLEAYAIEPYRTDLLISAANAQIYNKNVDRAIELFEQGLSVAPEHVDLHAYLAIWKKFKGNEGEYQKHLSMVSQLNQSRATDIKRIIETIGRIVATPLKDEPNRDYVGKNAIVTLGYALNPDGSMHEILEKRLETTLSMSKNYPDALIILTGGVPKNHKTEAKLMADWLVDNGISRDRIIEENYATSTVDNALLSSFALARHDIDHATIISSASHVRRGQSLFEIASWETGPKGITFDTVAYPDKPLAELAKPSSNELLGIYRDALRTYGMWSFRSAPLISR